MKFLDLIKSIEPDKKKSPFLHTLFDGFFTFAFAPNTVTKGGVHVRDGMDLKRTMVHVVLAMQLCYLFGTYNIGHQHFVAIGEHTAFLSGFHLKLVHGLIKLLPLFVVANVVGLGIEFFYATKKGHPIEEGFLVSGALIPLIMPPDLPLWMLAVAVAFAVIIGKEAFGGTGMNILNIALLARVFIFFAYPLDISGDEVWISNLVKDPDTQAIAGGSYSMVHGFFDWIFGAVGLPIFGEGGRAVVDGFTGATPLGLAAKGGWEAVTAHYSPAQMFWGTIPGSIGETSKPLVAIGALFLVVTGIASWRIMLSMILGCALMGMIFNAWDITAFMDVPWIYHFYMGSFLFAMAFMATDPVTAASTNRGKWIYGFLIGSIGLIIRVINPAYPEGWMLAILLFNVFAPLIDHYVIEGNIQKRMKRATT
jgi:Na+-transporting NADH:ubiquinone oxidoreductase subunit B